MTELFLPARGSHVLVRLLKGSSQGQQDPDQKKPIFEEFQHMKTKSQIPWVDPTSWAEIMEPFLQQFS